MNPGRAIRRILFLTHEATRTGAPLVLLHFLRWLRERPEYEPTIVLRRSGALAADFASLGPVLDLETPRRSTLARARRAADRAAGKPLPMPPFLERLTELDLTSFDLVYANTGAHGDILDALGPGVPVLSHIHELDFSIGNHLPGGWPSVLARTDRFVAVSEAVQEGLQRRHGVPAERIDHVHPTLPLQTTPDPERATVRDTMRRRYGIPLDAIVVLGCGTLSWIKGSDLLPSIAREVFAHDLPQPVRFVWVGGSAQPLGVEQLHHDLGALGLRDRVLLTGPVEDTKDFYRMADIFLLPSREDSFPLVAMEAAAEGLPIVCFTGSGGAGEWVSWGAGVAAPYLDPIALGAAIVGLARDHERRREVGARATERIPDLDIRSTAPRLLTVIERTITGRPRGSGPGQSSEPVGAPGGSSTLSGHAR